MPSEQVDGFPQGGGPNPHNSLTRADTFGIRPDLFFRLADVVPKRPEMEQLMQQQKATADRAEGLAGEISEAVTKADFAEYDGDLQARLWGDQGEFNKITAQFQQKQVEIDAAQNRSIQLLSLYNHGALYIQSSYVLEAKTWKVLDFSGVRGRLIGCEPISVQMGGASGMGLRFLSPGDWDVDLRVTLPPGNTVAGTSTAIGVRAIAPGGQEIGAAKATSRNDGYDETLVLRTTVSVPEAGSFVFAQAYASTTSGASGWWPSDTGPELTELSVRQLSVAV
ncbi:hypothetical protein DF219_07615 [Corynebacterium liangguodongii]|nr:hypothetical protein DF219_07615 [Corynebacterium liangguodongii]